MKGDAAGTDHLHWDPPDWVVNTYLLSIFTMMLLSLYFCGFAENRIDEIVLCNHTGGEITVSFRLEENIVIQNNSSAHIPLTHNGSPTFVVVTAKRIVWSYAIRHPPNDYRTRRLSQRVAATGYQIEVDGSIYAVKPDSDFPVEQLPPQPPKFPLIPYQH